ncbi:unnamed protein product [Symbiodinium sp. CCMP2592]|nr:unnamed protein product [Symbiodinium sp. CCMP2592]
MGIVKRHFSAVLIEKFYHREGSPASLPDSESEDNSSEMEVAVSHPCESVPLVLDGQTDIRDYFLASWRWQKVSEGFLEDSEAATAMGLPFHMCDDDVTLPESEVETQVEADFAASETADCLVADEEAAEAMGLPFHTYEDDYGLVVSTEMCVEEVALPLNHTAESTGADEKAAEAMGLPFHINTDDEVPTSTEAAVDRTTPPRRRRQPLDGTPCKKPRVAERTEVEPSKVAEKQPTVFSAETSMQVAFC